MMVLDFFIPEGLVHCNHCICLLNTHEVVCSVIITLLARFLKIKAFFWSVWFLHARGLLGSFLGKNTCKGVEEVKEVKLCWAHSWDFR